MCKARAHYLEYLDIEEGAPEVIKDSPLLSPSDTFRVVGAFREKAGEERERGGGGGGW